MLELLVKVSSRLFCQFKSLHTWIYRHVQMCNTGLDLERYVRRLGLGLQQEEEQEEEQKEEEEEGEEQEEEEVKVWRASLLLLLPHATTTAAARALQPATIIPRSYSFCSVHWKMALAVARPRDVIPD